MVENRPNRFREIRTWEILQMHHFCPKSKELTQCDTYCCISTSTDVFSTLHHLRRFASFCGNHIGKRILQVMTSLKNIPKTVRAIFSYLIENTGCFVLDQLQHDCWILRIDNPPSNVYLYDNYYTQIAYTCFRGNVFGALSNNGSVIFFWISTCIVYKIVQSILSPWFT